MNRIILNKEGDRVINSIIYKYFSINDFFYSTITNNQIWFSDPNTFNDPYDCNLNYDWSNITFIQIYEKLKSIREKRFPNVSLEYTSKRAKEIYDNVDQKDAFKLLIEKLVEDQGISCFSEKDDSLLMWSHYADKHTGVCLGFDIIKDKDFFYRPYKVDYPLNYPKINPINSTEELQTILATKSQEWSYEQEIRIIKDKADFSKNRGTVKFKPEALIEIKFGYRTSQETIEKIKKITFGKGDYKVKFYKAVLKKYHFGLDFQEIT